MTSPPQMPRLGASACVWRDGKVLLIQRAKPPLTLAWSLPGGHVEAGETTLEAASRELLEETGIQADLQQLAGLYDIIRRDVGGAVSLHYVIACYTGFWRSGEAVAQSDAAAVWWVPPAELNGLAFVPNVRAAISRSQELLRL